MTPLEELIDWMERVIGASARINLTPRLILDRAKEIQKKAETGIKIQTQQTLFQCGRRRVNIYTMIAEETEILQCILEKLKTRRYYLSWWLRLDLNNKYTTAKINYELKKAVKEGLLIATSHHHGIEYCLPSIIDNKKN